MTGRPIPHTDTVFRVLIDLQPYASTQRGSCSGNRPAVRGTEAVVSLGIADGESAIPGMRLRNRKHGEWKDSAQIFLSGV